ncbi:mitochondrial small ribosomal subunit Rsm22-domain-containing protein [Xylaria nigripes]|nr:mitochondrial small ribosomal subunit Rsm22-domain-containing protein [Xylaria nigripes]
MLSAARARRPCPQCRRQFLNILENTFAHASSDAPAFPRFRAGPHPTARPRRIDSKCFSTTRSTFQETGSEPPSETKPEIPPAAKPEAQPSTPEEIELVVRQARRAFGDTLPKNYLTDEEYKIYVRLYGPPLRETQPEDVGMPIREGDIPTEEWEVENDHDPSQKVILREMQDGNYEEVVYETEEVPSSHPEPSSDGSYKVGIEPAPVDILSQDLPSEPGLAYINAVASNQREFDALLKLQKDFEAASLRQPEEEIEEEPLEEDERDERDERDEDERDEEDEGEPESIFGSPSERAHEYTRLGQWGTYPSTIQLPKNNFVMPISQLLERTSVRHIKEAAENIFGGSALPFSVATPPSRKNVEQKAIPLASNYHKMSEIDADVFISTMLPGMYASSMAVLVEIRKRLGSDWMAKLMSRGNGEGPRVLDVGTGGAALAAWERVLQAEWSLAREKGMARGLNPPGKKTVVVGSEHLRYRVSRFLYDTTFLPRLPDYLHSGDHPDKLEGGSDPLQRKQFDIIFASHQMLPLTEGFRRKAMLDNLWEMLSPEGGILIVLEKAHPQGFEAVADVRARLLDEFIESPYSDPRPGLPDPDTIRQREPGMIIAPCTNHKPCPMYLIPGISPGRKDFCHFSQRFIRPPFLQKILGADHRNHEDINFSFIAAQRGTLPGTEQEPQPIQGDDPTLNAFSGYENSPVAPDPQLLPRNILPPIKSTGHVTLDLCTPSGKLERWVVPKSFSKQAYRDARKAKWGDLWALGAKTRTSRAVRLGKGGLVPNDGGMRSQRAAKAGKPRVISLAANARGIIEASEAGGDREPQRRTKGGKRRRDSNLMKELGLEED